MSQCVGWITTTHARGSARVTVRAYSTRMRSRLVAMLVMGGCSSSPPAKVDVASECAPIDQWAFPSIVVGQTASANFLVTAKTAGDLDVSLSGPAAAEFHIVADRSTCTDRASVEVGDVCTIHVELTPASDGPHGAALEIGGTTLPLGGGDTTSATSGLVATLRNAASLHGLFNAESRSSVEPVDDYHSTYVVSVRNVGATTVTFGTGEVTANGFSIAATNNCTTLGANNACEITVVASEFGPGCATGMYRLPTSANTIELPITNTFVGGVEIAGDGLGRGRIVSSPPGIDCVSRGDGERSGRCAGAFTEPVTLMATPESGHHFVGWADPACADADPTCTLQPTRKDDHGRTDAHRLAVTFATPGARKVDVQFAGDGTGFVGFTHTKPMASDFFPINLIEPPCRASCTRWFEPGMPVFAAAGTAARFDGFGGCGPGRICPLDLTNDVDLTATFSKAPDEELTLYPEVPASVGAFVPGGDLVVGGKTMVIPAPPEAVVSRLSPTGELRWTRRVTDHESVCSVKARSSGEIYVIAMKYGVDNTLLAFDGDGQIRWQRSLGRDGRSCTLAFAPNGDIITNGDSTVQGEQLMKFTPTGGVVWSITTQNGFYLARDRAIVLDAAGTIAQVESPQLGTYVVRRYDASGNPLVPWTLPLSGLEWANAMSDGQGGVVVQLMQGRTRNTVRLDASGAVVFTHADPMQVSGGFALDIEHDPSLGMDLRSDGQLFMWFAHAGTWDGGEGYHVNATLQRLDVSGAQAWTTEIVAAQPMKQGRGGGLPMDAQLISSSACDGSGRCALFGEYVGVGSGPWIQIVKP